MVSSCRERNHRHVTYAVLGAQAATARRLPVAPLLRRHWASYLCGAYLGCDIQTFPKQCVWTRAAKSGTAWCRWPESPHRRRGPAMEALLDGREYTRVTSTGCFTGDRTWSLAGARRNSTCRNPGTIWPITSRARPLTRGPALARANVRWPISSHARARGRRQSHQVRPRRPEAAFTRRQYTPRNRPIQDLITFHEVGRKELNLNWARPAGGSRWLPAVESLQPHTMRVARHAATWPVLPGRLEARAGPTA